MSSSSNRNPASPEETGWSGQPQGPQRPGTTAAAVDEPHGSSVDGFSFVKEVDAAAVTQGEVVEAAYQNGSVQPHPAAAGFFHAVPWMRRFPVLGIAVEAFGPVFIFSLGGCYFLMKGVTDNIVGYSKQPMMLKRFGITATRYQRLAGISTMGTSIKAFIAVITDIFPLFGYTKRWYMFASCIMGFAFTLGYGLLPAKTGSADIASGFIFLSVFSRANVDLLSEGHYSRLIRRNTAAGPAMVSWIWWMIMVGHIIASVIQGPLSDSGKMQIGVYVAAALHVIPSFIFIFNWYGEKRNRVERHEDAVRLYEELKVARREHRVQTGHRRREGNAVPVEAFQPEPGKIRMEPLEGENDDDLIGFSNAVAVADDAEYCDDDDGMEDFQEPDIVSFCCGAVEVNKEVFFRNWKIVVYSLVMTCAVITMACVTILGTTWDLLYACVSVSVVCCVCAFLTLPRVIAKANVFTYFDFVLYISLPGALDTFYVANEACVPGGPHFSYTFYNTISAVIQNTAGMVGVAMFTYMFSKMRYQVVMCLTVSIRIVASLFDLIMVERWNIAIGIPDHAMYLCGDAIVYQICYMLSYMPVILLMSRLCPRGSESMIYALMAGFANLGQTMSNTVGTLLIEFRFPFTTTPPCDFSNVRWLIIIGHLGMPCAIVPLSFLLLPRVRICDDIDVNGHAIHAQLKKERKTAARSGLQHRHPDNDSDELGPEEPPATPTRAA